MHGGRRRMAPPFAAWCFFQVREPTIMEGRDLPTLSSSCMRDSFDRLEETPQTPASCLAPEPCAYKHVLQGPGRTAVRRIISSPPRISRERAFGRPKSKASSASSECLEWHIETSGFCSQPAWLAWRRWPPLRRIELRQRAAQHRSVPPSPRRGLQSDANRQPTTAPVRESRRRLPHGHVESPPSPGLH